MWLRGYNGRLISNVMRSFLVAVYLSLGCIRKCILPKFLPVLRKGPFLMWQLWALH